MKATFNDFLTQNPNCSKFANDEDAQRIFDLLSGDLQIILMLEASDAGKPALTPFAANVEHIVADLNYEHAISLDDSFTKQAVGLMVKTILEPFGYVPWKQKDLPKSAMATKFQSASVYRRDPLKKATLRVKKTSEEI
jgi:hypothetical protein